jgi:cell wall-associated NlpC family hydrolase
MSAPQRRSSALPWLLALGAMVAAPHLDGAGASPAGRPPAIHGSPARSPSAGRAVAYARAQLGKPYAWGDEGPGSFDCSGLTWAAWRYAGLGWSRMTAADQWHALRDRAIPRHALQAGDLIFYAHHAGDWRSIHHVALYAGSGRMVEAPYSGALVREVPLRTRGWFGAARPGGTGR